MKNHGDAIREKTVACGKPAVFSALWEINAPGEDLDAHDWHFLYDTVIENTVWYGRF